MRQRTGTLDRRAGGIYFAQLTLDLPNGKTKRKWFNLETTDRAKAERTMARLVKDLASGRLVVPEVGEQGARGETVGERFTSWVEARIELGVSMGKDERGTYWPLVSAFVGEMNPSDVRTRHVEAALASMRDKGYAKGTIAHAKRMLSRFFKSLVKDETIASNPVLSADMPEHCKVDARKRRMLTDAEWLRIVATKITDATDVEILVIALVARTLGGARSCETNRWCWEHVDLDAFATCKLLRAKGDDGDAQDLEIPPPVRPILHAWWTEHGRPTSGPVFPVLKGKRKGKARGKTSYAARWRRFLERDAKLFSVPPTVTITVRTTRDVPIVDSSTPRA